MNALEKRTEAIATDLDHSTLPYFPDRAAAQIRALLAAHKRAKRELAACKSYLRLLTCANPEHEKCVAVRNGLKREGVKL